MPDSIKKSLVIFIYSALILGALLVFWRVWNFDFINWDDNHYVSENPHVLTGLTRDNIIWAFTTGHSFNWHPLTWLSFMLDCQLSGSNPGWMHLVNLLLHIANTLLLFAVLKKMTGALWPSAFVAAAFAIHPMHVESVAWITERKDILSTFFLLLTLAAYVSYVRRRGLFSYLLTFVTFALGLLAKPMLVTLPFALLLIDYWPLNRFAPQNVKGSGRQFRKSVAADRLKVPYQIIIEKIPLFVLAAVSSVVTFLVQQSNGAVGNINAFPLQGRIANVFLSYARYIAKLLWPQNLAVFYPYDAGSFTLWHFALCALLLFVISFAVLYFGRNQKYLPVGWFWFIGTLVPVIGIIQVGQQAYADRYTYIPYIGLFIIIAWGIPELLSKWPYRSPRWRDIATGKTALGMSMVIVLTALGICAHRQVSYWNNSSALFSHAIAVTQNNYVAHNNLAKDLRNQGETALALQHFKKAFQISPYYADTVNGIGMLLYDQGDSKQAIEYFQKAIQLKPGFSSAHNNLGFVLQNQGKLHEAVTHFKQAVQTNPDFILARNNLANVLVLQDRLDEAIDQLHAILRLEPDSAFAHQTLGSVLLKKGNVNQAIEQFNIVLKAEPNSVTAHSNIGYALSQQGKLDEAVAHFAQVVQISPDFAQARNNLANVLKLQGRLDEAVAQLRAAVRLKPDWTAPMNDLAWFTATHPELKGRDVNEAISLARTACQITDYKNPTFMGTLAAAYASAGRFPEAIDTAKNAMALADTANQPQVRNIIQYHLTFYTQNIPYIESDQKPLPDSNKP